MKKSKIILLQSALQCNFSTWLYSLVICRLQLALYRHWSLVESMRHSLYTATTLKLWTLKGEKRLHELLAEMG